MADGIGAQLVALLRQLLRPAAPTAPTAPTGRPDATRASSPGQQPAPRREPAPGREPAARREASPSQPRATGYAGDFTGRAVLEYRPRADGHPDPGEIVWAWVPFEENDGRGKDRPVLVIARDGELLLGLMLTSKDHERDAAAQSRQGRHWLDLGNGDWDREGRPSEVRTDRILRLEPTAVRREGAALDRARYDRVAAEVRRVHGW